jgi:hypothetical protein
MPKFPDVTVDYFERLHSLAPEEACLQATLTILRVPHHVYFIEVTEDEDGLQEAVHDPFGRLNDVFRQNEGRLLTVEVPGFAGRHVCSIFPYAD